MYSPRRAFAASFVHAFLHDGLESFFEKFLWPPVKLSNFKYAYPYRATQT